MPENDVFPVAFDYGSPIRDIGGAVRSQSQSGRTFARINSTRRRVHQLEFRRRSTADKILIETWFRRFEASWFTLHDKVFAHDGTDFVERYFSVEFAGPPGYELVGNEQWNIRVALIDKVGAALKSYPDPDGGHDSRFLEESAGFVVAGTWTDSAEPLASEDKEKTNDNSNTTDAFQWVYSGYGFRVRSRKGSALGTVEVLLDGVSLGNVDLNNAGDIVSQAVFTKLDVPLGLHTAQLKATNTGGIIVADALEVME